MDEQTIPPPPRLSTGPAGGQLTPAPGVPAPPPAPPLHLVADPAAPEASAAPPTASWIDPAWAPPGSNEPSLPPLFAPVPDEPPRRSRGPVFAFVAALAIVVLAVGAVFALRGGDGGGDSIAGIDDSSGDAAEQFSLAAAAQEAADASTVRYELSMSLGPLGTVTSSGGIDTDAGIMVLTFDFGSMFGGPVGEGPGSVEAILDAGNGVMYMTTDGLGLPADTPWVSMDLAMVAEQGGMTIEDFQDQMATDPFDVAALFADSDQVVDLGPDTIDGVEVRHYQVTVDFADALAANPQLAPQLPDPGGAFPDQLVYDVWVTADNQLRRMSADLTMLGEEILLEMTLSEVDEPLDVQIPPPDQVTDFTGLFGL